MDPWTFTDAGLRLDGVAVVDIATGTVTTVVPLPGLIPSSLAVDSTAHKIYVSALANGTGAASITTIDGTTNMVTGTPISVTGLGDMYMQVDPSTHKLFGYSGTTRVDVFDVSANSFVTAITLTGYDSNLFGNTQGGLALDPASHNLWVLGPAGDDAGIATSSMLTVIDGTANAAGAQTPYTGTPTYLADDTASTGNVFVVTQNPQHVVLDGPVSFQVPAGYTVWLVDDVVCGSSDFTLAFLQDASGNFYYQAFLANGMPDGSPRAMQWGLYSPVAVGILTGDLEVVLVEGNVGGSPALLPTVKRVKGC